MAAAIARNSKSTADAEVDEPVGRYYSSLAPLCVTVRGALHAAYKRSKCFEGGGAACSDSVSVSACGELRAAGAKG